MARITTISLSLAVLCTGLAIACSGFVNAAPPSTPPGASNVNPMLLKQFQEAGKGASITVLPTLLAGKPMPQVGNVVGMFLERGGMSDVQTSAEEFQPPKDSGLAQTAEALGEFVKAHQFQTEYVLFNDFQASSKQISEVRSIVVNRKGELVWTDSQTPADADFKRIKPKEPMQCCILVAERIRPVLKLDDPMRKGAPEGKLAQKWDKETGVPDKAEMAAIEKRQSEFKKSSANAALLILPARTGDEISSASAANLTAMINKDHLIKSTAAEQGPKLTAKPNMNEQKVLWSMARAFRDEVRKSPHNADYVLYADYMMNGNAVGAVHFVVCDRQGEWVIVDFQNSHQADFKAINPKSRDDCDRLVLRRLQHYCK